MTSTSTTYRNDFVPPLTGYKLIKSLKNQQAYECELFCKAQENIPKPKPKRINTEWTGIGPMGLLLDPRVIPFEPTADDIDHDAINTKKINCVEDKNSEFLEMVRTCYPHIYERWYNWPKYKWQMDIARNKTTYKMDYRHLVKQPDEIQPEDKLYKVLDNIMEKTIPPECEEYYKPFNLTFTGPPNSRRTEYDYGPYLLDPEKMKTTEYMDNISRTGCIIVRNNIHTHQKSGSYVHKLVNQCKNYNFP